MNRRTLIGGAVVGLFAAILLWPDDEPPDSSKKTSEPSTSTGPVAPSGHRFRPGGPEYEEREQRYGGFAPPPTPEYRPVPQSPSPYYGYPQDGAAPYAPFAPQPDPMERFSFRPLSERERERLEADRPDAYHSPPPPQPYAGWGRQPESPDQRRAPAYPDSYRDGYGYRAYPAERDARRGPYRDRRDGQDVQDAWPVPPEPQWGSQPRDWAPPAQRMYPNLDVNAGRRFTAR